MRRLVGIAAAPPRRRFGEAVEGVQRDDRGQQRMAAVPRNDGRPARVRLHVDDERRGAERGETIDGFKEPLARGVGGREGEARRESPRFP